MITIPITSDKVMKTDLCKKLSNIAKVWDRLEQALIVVNSENMVRKIY